MAKKRAELGVTGRRKEAARLYLEGHTQAAIGERLGVNQSTVSRDLDAVRQEWKDNAVHDVGEVKAKELAKLDALEVQHWEAWRRSVGTHVKTTKTVKGRKVETVTVSEDLAGDPRFLAEVLACVERRCKLLGADAPKALTATIGVPLKVVGGIDMGKM